MEIDTKIIIIDVIFFILISIMHFTFSFFIRATDFHNLFDTFESSPLFDFELNTNCGFKDNIIFHTWEGYEKTEYYYERGRKKSRTETVDKTYITKINSYLFCYNKKISYRELLYNGQIIKKGENCKNDYNDCGTIDTLEQKLCIKNGDSCPLYDVRLNPDSNIRSIYNTDTESKSDIYYNKPNFEDIPNKKIIGKLILNDGQPCYNAKEKLWRKFNSKEVGYEHLKCELEIFGNYNDNRFEELGRISYKKIYEDNLISYGSRELFSNIDTNIKVSLYKREFLGIDKECDSKSDTKREDYDELEKSQEMEKTVLLVEGVIAFFCIFEGIVAALIIGGNSVVVFMCNVIIMILTYISCMICSSVNLVKMKYYSVSYDCSDSITNEVFRKENQNTKILILYTAINLGFDVFFILIHILGYLYKKINCDCCYNCNCNWFCSCFKKIFESNHESEDRNNNYNNKYDIYNNITNKKYEDLGVPEGPISKTPANINEINQNNIQSNEKINTEGNNNNQNKIDAREIKIIQYK